jgi:hypothetical protein
VLASVDAFLTLNPILHTTKRYLTNTISSSNYRINAHFIPATTSPSRNAYCCYAYKKHAVDVHRGA